MFDPTVFDNLKVVIEGGLYDLDREGQIVIISRKDLMDLATMSRTFSMRFGLPAASTGSAEIEIASEIADFAAELIRFRLADNPPGCQMSIRYRFEGIVLSDDRLQAAADQLKLWWEEQAHLVQTAESAYDYVENHEVRLNASYTADLTFINKIQEQQIEQLPELMQHTIDTLQRLTLLITA